MNGFAFVTRTLTNANSQFFGIRYPPRYIPLFPTLYVLFKRDTLVWNGFLFGPADAIASMVAGKTIQHWVCFNPQNIPSTKVLVTYESSGLRDA